MNYDLKEILIFVGGVITGVGSAMFLLDKDYDNRLEEARRNLESYYSSKPDLSELKRETKKTEERKPDESTNTGREKGILKNDERVKIKETWSDDTGEFIDYTKYYKAHNSTLKISEPENTKKTTTDEDDIDISNFSDDSRRINISPKIASEREMELLPRDGSYEFMDMKYFVYDDTLVLTPEEDPWQVVDQEEYLGDCLVKEGFDQNDEDTLYVINYLHETVYTVHKTYGMYSERIGDKL